MWGDRLTAKTFSSLWIEGLGDAVGEVDPEQTLRLDSGDFGRVGMSLPHLTMSEEDDTAADNAQLVLLDQLGEGGMGVVYLARQPLLDRDVAIKRLKIDAPDSAGLALLREGRYMGRLEHPNIIPVHAMGADDAGDPVLVMKRIGGVDWRDLIEKPEHPAWRSRTTVADTALGRNVEVLIEVCGAIAYAHSQGVLHLDIKPENVRIGSYGEVYLMDWGIASRVDAAPRGHVVGTPAYMAPEMVDLVEPLTPQTDVYLLGGCLYEVLTGKPVHQGDTIKEVLESAHRGEMPSFSAGASPGLVEICTRALASVPEERFEQAAQVQVALTEWLRNQGTERLVASASVHADTLTRCIQDGDAGGAAAAFSAAHFGFTQALVDLPDHALAGLGLVTALEQMAAFELTRDNLDHVALLRDELAALGVPSEALGKQLAVRTRALAKQRELARGLALETDVLPRSAYLVTVGICFFVAIAGAAAGWLTFDTNMSLFRAAVILNLPVFVLAFVFRAAVLRTTASRLLISALMAAAVATMLTRAIGVVVQIPLHAQFAIDLVAISASSPPVVWMAGPRAVPLVLTMLAGSAGCLLLPAHAPMIFGVVITISMIYLAAVLYRTSPRLSE
jgi:eukaryotic-like serine/threonine-protein kinase